MNIIKFVDFICNFVEIISYRVIILCFGNGSTRTSNSDKYVLSKHELFVCNLKMDLNELKLHICVRIEIDPTVSTVNISFKYGINRKFLTYQIEDEEALEAMWKHSKVTLIPYLELYVEEALLRNQDVNVVTNRVECKVYSFSYAYAFFN